MMSNDLLTSRMDGFEARHPHHRFDRRDFEKYALAMYKQMNTAFAAYSSLDDEE